MASSALIAVPASACAAPAVWRIGLMDCWCATARRARRWSGSRSELASRPAIPSSLWIRRSDARSDSVLASAAKRSQRRRASSNSAYTGRSPDWSGASRTMARSQDHRSCRLPPTSDRRTCSRPGGAPSSTRLRRRRQPASWPCRCPELAGQRLHTPLQAPRLKPALRAIGLRPPDPPRLRATSSWARSSPTASDGVSDGKTEKSSDITQPLHRVDRSLPRFRAQPDD